MSERSFRFSHAIVRKPCATIIDGLRAVDIGAPDLGVMEQHHAQYVAVLKSAGAQIILLDAQEQFPDSMFVEDTALCLREGAIILRPGAPSRLGEAALMKPVLEGIYDAVEEISGPGFIEGGDILVTEHEILVGTSERTDNAGIEALGSLVSRWGYKVRKVETPAGVLHFKTDCSLLDAQTILSTKRLDASGCFNGYKVIHTEDGEEACANAIRFNEIVIMPSGFPKTKTRLEEAGYIVHTVGNSEAAKLDGGMSCLSLRFSPLVTA